MTTYPPLFTMFYVGIVESPFDENSMKKGENWTLRIKFIIGGLA
jgi:hypothetical protein